MLDFFIRHNNVPFVEESVMTKPYDTAREERDYLLEYKSIDLGSLYREEILGIPLDNVTRDEAVAVIMDLIEKKNGPQHIFFLDPEKLMRIRSRKKLKFIVEDARMILADGAGLLWGSEKLGHPLKERIPMIAFLMDVIRLSVKKDFTIYLLGSRSEHLEKVFMNLQKSFPGVRIIGRQSGYFNPARESLIKESLRKSAPDLIFLGMGFPLQEKWFRENKAHLSNAVVVGVDGAFDILSGKIKKGPDWAQTRGLIWLWRSVSRPWNVLRFYRMLSYYIKIFFTAMFKKKDAF